MKIGQFLLGLIRYMNNKGWFLCRVVYNDIHPRGRPYLSWKDAMMSHKNDAKKEDKIIITICAFTDNQPNSVAYRKFTDIDKAVEFYRKQLERDCVHVISTRKIDIQEVKDDP